MSGKQFMRNLTPKSDVTRPTALGLEDIAHGGVVISLAGRNSNPVFRKRADMSYSGINGDKILQEALDALPSEGGTVLFDGYWDTSGTIMPDRGQRLLGTSRRGARICPQAQTFAAITVPSLGAGGLAVVEWETGNYTIDYSTATGSVPATNAAAVGIKLVSDVPAGPATNFPYFFDIHDVSMFYPYDGFNADWGPFMFGLSKVYVYGMGHYGFHSLGGTTQTYDKCYTNGGAAGSTPFSFVGVDQLLMLNCANDNNPAGGSKVYLVSCRFNIMGLFQEANTCGNGDALILCSGSRGLISSWDNASNVWSATNGNEAYGLRVIDSSVVNLLGQRQYNPTSNGAGTSFQVIVGSTDQLYTDIDVSAATGTGTNYGIYTIAGGATAVGNPATLTSTQTLTNKTLTSPTIQGIVGAGTGLTLPAFTVSGDIDAAGVLISGGIASSLEGWLIEAYSPLLLWNPAKNFYYSIPAAAITANRTLNLPLITGTDTLAVLDLPQVLQSKTLTSSILTSPSITNPITTGVMAEGLYSKRASFGKGGMADATATSIFTITTTNEAGNTDNGQYLCEMTVLGYTHQVGGSFYSSVKSGVYHFVRAMRNTGVGVNSAVVATAETAATDSGAGDDIISSITVTVVETSEYIQTVKIAIDYGGTQDPNFGGCVVDVKLVWSVFATAPVLAAV